MGCLHSGDKDVIVAHKHENKFNGENNISTIDATNAAAQDIIA